MTNPTFDKADVDAQPLHIPGAIQPHGAMLVVRRSSLVIVQASNSAVLQPGQDASAVLNQALDGVVGAAFAETLRRVIREGKISRRPSYIATITPAGQSRSFDVLAHAVEDMVILELEPTVASTLEDALDPYRTVKQAMAKLQSAHTLDTFFQATADYVCRITGFDRVMVYRFQEDESGMVVGESRQSWLPPLLGLHYPAVDIPRPARTLYLQNWLRLIPDVPYGPVALEPVINPVTGHPLDMSYAVLRSVHPCHIEYMVNMGVRASMSISLIKDNQLWGLIACHHYSGARFLSFDTRTACELLGVVFSSLLTAKEENEQYEQRLQLSSALVRFVGQMSGTDNLVKELRRFTPALPDLLKAGGAAIVINGDYHSLGDTPSEADTRSLVEWIATNYEDSMFWTHSLASIYSPGESLAATASGVVALAISRHHRDYLLWFRPEVIHTVSWGGDPNKPFEVHRDSDGNVQRLSPRGSFEEWKQTVRATSRPWQKHEVAAAREMLTGLIIARESMERKRAESALHQAKAQVEAANAELEERVAQRTAELYALNAELEQRVQERTAELEAKNQELEAFTYSVSHDLKAPLRGIDGYSRLLLDDYTDQLDEEGQFFLRTIRQSTDQMRQLIDDLLAYSRIERRTLEQHRVGLVALVEAMLAEREDDIRAHAITVQVDIPCQMVIADMGGLSQVVRNLLDNAIKFTSDAAAPEIVFGGEVREQSCILTVRDNGIGFDMQYHAMIFDIFQRLHRAEDYPGTGIGLAIVRKAMQRMKGNIWAESMPGQGTTFFIEIPREQEL